MGNYNPHAPQILGQEWVPIRQANYIPDHTVERGYTFRINHTALPVTGAYYVAEVPDSRTNVSSDLIAVYPAGRETLTGPIKKLHIPVSSIAVTGSTIDISAGAAALLKPSDDTSIRFDNPGNNAQLGIQFDTASYLQQLTGKRILDVSIRYSIAGEPKAVERMLFSVGFSKNLSTFAYSYNAGANEFTPVGQANRVNSFTLGDLNPFWDGTADPTLNRDIFPWRYPELNRFAATEAAATRMTFLIANTLGAFVPGNSAFLYFVDMEITYCEETRVLYGGRKTAYLFATPHSNDSYSVGAQLVRLRDINLASATTSLTPGEYTVTLTHTDSHINTVQDHAPVVHALRELYQLPHQRGLNVTRTLVEESQFTDAETPVLTHLTLHTSAAVVTGVHAYGTQNDVPVYGTITATQEIEDDPVPSAAVFPQVRFYARRFGDTTVPLTLVDVATGLSTASISVADFDALTEIVDGWREVNLRFATAPSFAVAAGDIDWRWSATGELAGNQWQVLAADGPGTSIHSIGPATYYAPNGSTVALTWQSPPISGLAEDSLSDATLIFSQDPMPVSGFALEIAEQEVDAALECDTLSGCVASGISYVNLSWTAQTFLPVTGFGQYELERYDAIDAEWRLIMSATSPSVTGFADYEARVGVQTFYRIRTCNLLDFCGPWVTGSATIPTPGVTIGGDGNSMLIFTSNREPTSNLAYTMSWEGEPVETYAFPEADEVQLQRMFNRDFFVAFHPLERGGEQFTRSVVVNAAAIPLPSLANFRGLRDLAWDQLNYVCVRDELGNRWFANVRVPTGVVRQNRTVYVAQVQIAEVTDTPDPIDPAEAS